MTKWLIKTFVKDADNLQDAMVRSAYGKFAGIVGILANILLFVGKLIAGVISGALSIVADAFNNLSDAASSLVT
ncbi:MAG: cation transporter [Clostridia bacterium]|nr:cation transporter [Clostridia bacterium]